MAYRDSTVRRTTASTSVVGDRPAGVQSGDHLLAIINYDGQTTITTPPTGWTSIGGTAQQASPDGQSTYLYEKIATGSEPATYTWTTSAVATAITAIGAWSGRAGTRTFTTPTTNTSNNSSPVSVGASSGTAAAGDDLVFLYGLDQTNGTDIWVGAPPTNYTEAEDDTNGDWATVYMAYRDNVSAGAQGTITGTATRSSGSGGAGWKAFVVALAAAGGGGATTTKTAEDTLTVSDANVAGMLRNALGDDALSVSDNAVAGMVRYAILGSAISALFDDLFGYYVRSPVAESDVSVTDGQNWFLMRQRLAESGVIVFDETISQIIGSAVFNIIVTDALAVTDESVKWLRFNRSLDDGIDVTDNAVMTFLLRRIAGDAIGMTDEALAQVIGQNIFAKIMDDGLLLSDGLISSAIRGRVAESTVLTSDATVKTLQIVRDLIDGLQATDEPLTALYRFLTLDDAIQVSDDLQSIYLADQVFSPRIVIGVDQPKIQVGSDQPFIQLGGYAL